MLNKCFKSLFLLILILIDDLVVSIDIDNVYDFYSLHARDKKGNVFSLSKYRGKVTIFRGFIKTNCLTC